jgi:AraC-like DNA-binding protein
MGSEKAKGQAMGQNDLIDRALLTELLRGGKRAGGCCLPPKNDRDRAPLLRGRLMAMDLASGLHLHAADTEDLSTAITRALVEPRVTVMVFLAGDTEVSLGSRRLRLGAPQGGARAYLLTSDEPELFVRRGQVGRRTRKVNVSLPGTDSALQWLEAAGVERTLRRIGQDRRDEMESVGWAPGARLIELAERIFAAAAYGPGLERLYLESCALEIAAEATRSLTALEDEASARLDARATASLRRVRDFIDARDNADFGLEELARVAGMSVSTLQRLFRTAHGESVFAYMRGRKLANAKAALARDKVSVIEAAYIAGYAGPANFATAFKRRYGVSPSAVRRGEG